MWTDQQYSSADWETRFRGSVLCSSDVGIVRDGEGTFGAMHRVRQKMMNESAMVVIDEGARTMRHGLEEHVV